MMIYLIDDKKNRQEEDYGWNREKLEKFSPFITPVYNYEDIKKAEKRRIIFSNGNIILFHESFFDNTTNIHNKDSVDIRADLNKFAEEKGGWVVFFSGSKSSRTLTDRVAHIPVSVLYKNLEDFINKIAENIIDLRCLLYGGKNPEIEEELINRLYDANTSFDETPLILDQVSFLALTGSRINIPVILEGAIEKTFVLEEKYNREITSSYLDDKVHEWLSGHEVDNIFIPLCFGPSLSDYNGLQFACHIRCTDIINRLKPIFIYSFVDYSFLINNEYFNILKTKNVFLIDYSRQALSDSSFRRVEPFTNDQLPKEMLKLKLELPGNYEDSHGIANEWAVYRWAASIAAIDYEIEKIINKVNSQLYYKYLKTIYPKSEIPIILDDKLKIKYSGQPRVLYIDDEADKGWYEIFCKLLYDINGLGFEYLDEEFNSKTQEEIIKISIDKILKDEIEIVILDFRLHPNDFGNKNIEEVTGLKLLREIKQMNPGIQVVMFSATNKVWNFKALQKGRADGFIMKESPENSVDVSFTSRSIMEFINTMRESVEKIFLKSIFDYLHKVKIQLDFAENVPENNRFNKFIKNLKKQLEVIHVCAENITLDRPMTLAAFFLCCYSFLDLFKKHYLIQGDDYRYYLGFRREELTRYSVMNNNVQNGGPFIPVEHYEKPGIFHVYCALLQNYFDNQGVYDTNMFIRNFHRVKEYRNDYIHGTKTQFNKEEVLTIVESLVPITHYICE